MFTKNEIEKMFAKYSMLLNDAENSYYKAPRGYIRAIQRGKAYAYYHCENNGSDGKHLSKENIESNEMIEKLANKRYWKNILPVLRSNVAVLSYARKKWSEMELGDVYDKLPQAIKEYVNPYEISDEENAKRWIRTPYAESTRNPGGRSLTTDSGIKVRSKSELMIANALTSKGLYFKYEKLVTLQDGLFAPDFTILNKRTRQEVIWEHFGMMSDPIYQESALRKLHLFANYCSENKLGFIATFESNTSILTTEYVLDTIRLNGLV